MTVEEELIKTRTITETINNEQRTRTETYQEWRTIVDEQAMSDFYLQDGATKVFINGSKAGFGKIQSVRDASASTSIFSQPPPGIQYLIGRHLGNAWNWFANQGRTGRFRYTQVQFRWSVYKPVTAPTMLCNHSLSLNILHSRTISSNITISVSHFFFLSNVDQNSIYAQSSFDVNELVAALGVVRAGIDPMTSQPLKILDPITSNAVRRSRISIFPHTGPFWQGILFLIHLSLLNAPHTS